MWFIFFYWVNFNFNSFLVNNLHVSLLLTGGKFKTKIIKWNKKKTTTYRWNKYCNTAKKYDLTPDKSFESLINTQFSDLTFLIKLILSSSLIVVISHAINSDDGRLLGFLLELFPKMPRFNFGLFPALSSSWLLKSPYRNRNKQKSCFKIPVW